MKNIFSRAIEIYNTFPIEHENQEKESSLFAKTVIFLEKNNSFAKLLKNENVSDESYIKKIAKRFIKARNLHCPSIPKTVSDGMIDVILFHYYDITKGKIGKIKKYHNYCMSAENFIGLLLERYIASKVEKDGWIWCSGDYIRAIDFIKPIDSKNTLWHLLQIKNRDNSENSSSSAIRQNTSIQKWFRMFSKTGETNWLNFPDDTVKGIVSEEDFEKYVKQYLLTIRNASLKI